MRPIFVTAILLLCGTLHAQEGFFASSSPSDPLEQRIEALEALVAKLKSCVCQCDCGKAKQAPQAAEWSITMESIPGCNACDFSEANDQPRYKAGGWKWETNRLPGPQPGAISYPRFMICNGASCVVIDGLRNVSELDGRVQQAISQMTGQRRGLSLGKF